MKKLLAILKRRPVVQALVTLLYNPHIKNFFTGRIAQGKTKFACVPGLNCYSCPAAAAACPIGGLQAVLTGNRQSVSYYVFGLLLLFGTLLGRFVCGFLCPFGFVQDLLFRVKVKKLKVLEKPDHVFRYLKYAVLLVLVILLPMFYTGASGVASPYFCKWLCPAGTLEGGVPLVLADGTLREGLGFLFGWKIAVLAALLALSLLLYRPFCKYLCPLGAFYSLFNGISFYQLRIDPHKCTHCGVCARVCHMGVNVPEKPASPECIRCGDCKRACPHGAISTGFCTRKKEPDADGAH